MIIYLKDYQIEITKREMEMGSLSHLSGIYAQRLPDGGLHFLKSGMEHEITYYNVIGNKCSITFSDGTDYWLEVVEVPMLDTSVE